MNGDMVNMRAIMQNGVAAWFRLNQLQIRLWYIFEFCQNCNRFLLDLMKVEQRINAIALLDRLGPNAQEEVFSWDILPKSGLMIIQVYDLLGSTAQKGVPPGPYCSGCPWTHSFVWNPFKTTSFH